MFRNPLSSNRRQWLFRYLQKKLTKSRQLDLLANLSQKFDDIGEADPTRTGEYSRWILDLLVDQKISLPEDVQKLFELLTHYHRVKPRLPIEARQIHKFKSYSELRIYLLPLLPTLKSRSELVSQGSELLGTQISDEDIYHVYKLTTPEAASEISKNTGWCVCNIKTAAEYLKDGPLYVILKNDDPYILAHLESHQVMDVNDNYLLPESEGLKITTGEEYTVIVSLFKKYLPQFICRKPLKDAPLFPHGLIANLVCVNHDKDLDNSGFGCLECGFTFCEFDRCDNLSCFDHSWVCQECHKNLCNEHAETCCSAKDGKAWCQNDIQHCRECGENICDECSNSCEGCDVSRVCNKCTVTCGACKNTYCNQHGSAATCRECEKDICKKCIEDGFSCSNCAEYFCENCVKKCDECGSNSCPHCMAECPSCKRDICYDCNYYCREHCEKTLCSDCYDNICNICNKHAQELTACENCEDQQLCELCAVGCSKCRGSVCYDKVIWCNCGARHSFCSDCAESLMCFCGRIACDPEQHFICSYITRWR